MNDSEKSYLFHLAHLGNDSRKSKLSENIGGSSETNIDLLLSIIGREALREKRPNLQELDQIIKNFLEQENVGKESTNGQDVDDNREERENSNDWRSAFSNR